MQKISQLAATGQILLLLGTHLYFTFRLRFIQRKIPCGIRLSFSGKNNTSYSALATALAATIGTGNIIGISTAIAVGGAGAVFWCWITGVLGIATCYGECFLSMKYRKTEKDGKRIGGPMYVLERGMQQNGQITVRKSARGKLKNIYTKSEYEYHCCFSKTGNRAEYQESFDAEWISCGCGLYDRSTDDPECK